MHAAPARRPPSLSVPRLRGAKRKVRLRADESPPKREGFLYSPFFRFILEGNGRRPTGSADAQVAQFRLWAPSIADFQAGLFIYAIRLAWKTSRPFRSHIEGQGPACCLAVFIHLQETR